MSGEVQADYDEYVGNKTAPYFVYVLIARLKKSSFVKSSPSLLV